MKAQRRIPGTFAHRMEYVMRECLGLTTLDQFSELLGNKFSRSVLNKIMSPEGSVHGGGRYYEDVMSPDKRADTREQLARRLPPDMAAWIATGEGNRPPAPYDWNLEKALEREFSVSFQSLTETTEDYDAQARTVKRERPSLADIMLTAYNKAMDMGRTEKVAWGLAYAAALDEGKEEVLDKAFKKIADLDAMLASRIAETPEFQEVVVVLDELKEKCEAIAAKVDSLEQVCLPQGDKQKKIAM